MCICVYMYIYIYIHKICTYVCVYIHIMLESAILGSLRIVKPRRKSLSRRPNVAGPARAEGLRSGDIESMRRQGSRTDTSNFWTWWSDGPRKLLIGWNVQYSMHFCGEELRPNQRIQGQKILFAGIPVVDHQDNLRRYPAKVYHFQILNTNPMNIPNKS